MKPTIVPIGKTPREAKIMSNKYGIETDIPIPGKGIQDKIPFAEMEVGNSVLVPPSDSSLGTVRSWCSTKGKELNRKYIARDTEEGIRVWRTK